MVTHPARNAVTVIEVEMELRLICDALHRVRHSGAAITKCGIRRRAAGAHNDVGAVCGGQLLNHRTNDSLRLHLLRDFRRWHVRFLHLKAGRGPWYETLDLGP